VRESLLHGPLSLGLLPVLARVKGEYYSSEDLSLARSIRIGLSRSAVQTRSVASRLSRPRTGHEQALVGCTGDLVQAAADAPNLADGALEG
jgi:hypothetical protein